MHRRIKYKQAVAKVGQVYNIAVSEDAECDMKFESPVKLRGGKVMFPNNHAARRRLASQLEQCRNMSKSPVKLPGVKVLLPRKHYWIDPSQFSHSKNNLVKEKGRKNICNNSFCNVQISQI